jgi:hypothetical protein
MMPQVRLFRAVNVNNWPGGFAIRFSIGQYLVAERAYSPAFQGHGVIEPDGTPITDPGTVTLLSQSPHVTWRWPDPPP